MTSIVILAVSVALQFAAAIMALRLTRLTGRSLAWVCLAIAIGLMAVRRTITLFRIINSGGVHEADVVAELVALLISVLMVVGIGCIAPLVRRLQRTQEILKLNEQLSLEIGVRQRIEQQLRTSNAELKQFAYVASHDLQEPLRSVISFCQLLKTRYAGQLDDQADTFIEHAVAGSMRMRTLIDDLLAFSRVETQGKDLVPTDTYAAFEQAVTNLRVAIEERQAQVTSDELPTVMADESQLVLLFQNLIGNAIKYCEELPPKIHVQVANDDDFWLFSIRDNGIGIAEEYQERIFDVFKRLHNRDEYEGTGMGLAICKKIVSRLGGRIWVESTPPRGSTFYFSIPKNNSQPTGLG